MTDRPFQLNSHFVEIGESSLSSDSIPARNIKSRPNENSEYNRQERSFLDTDEIYFTDIDSQSCELVNESNLSLPVMQSLLGNNLHSALNNGDLNFSNLWEVNYHEAAIFLEVCLE